MEKKLSVLKDYKLHLVALVVSIIAELIGPKNILVGDITIVLSPLIWSMLIVFAIYMIKPLKLVTEKNASTANYMMGVGLALLIAKLGVTSGSSMEEIKQAGLALVLQNFGNLGTILLALPLALLIGMKREAVGMSHSLSREANVGLIQDTYGGESAEFRGVMAVYIVGTLLGPIVMSVLASISIATGIVSPLGASMGVGAGSASMMTAGLGSLIEMYPELEAQMTAFAGLSNLISSVIALPLGVFLGLPLTEFLYDKLSRIMKRRGE
ncbi:DUF3100 domain-containing protein [Irregularibacter muris]|uniref:DUF3100 domain-containing protein n=1 Tax=Irregularibacter muris TaxID=1796619 RepID=A0AAE3HHU2_9FIRM|nr:DUF3100 domain-containing protein [Irregularibacter muris]MCR1899827.1 DUF3100 domain-containing protein [Irregularibacter muris]